jgi:hypothetical protein
MKQEKGTNDGSYVWVSFAVFVMFLGLIFFNI